MNNIQLTKERLRASLIVLRGHKSLVWYPIVSAIINALLIGALAYSIFTLPETLSSNTFDLTLLAMVLVVIILGNFFATISTAIFYVATKAALSGERMAFRTIVKTTWGKRKYLSMWWLFSSGVGVVLMHIHQLLHKLPGWEKGAGMVVDQSISSALSIGWGFSTFFAVPVIMEHPGTPIATLNRSMSLFKRSWVQNTSAGLAGVIGFVVVVAVAGLITGGINYLIYALNPAVPGYVFGIVFGVIAGLLLGTFAVISSAVHGLFRTSLYQYAETGDFIGPFSTKMIQDAFK